MLILKHLSRYWSSLLQCSGRVSYAAAACRTTGFYRVFPAPAADTDQRTARHFSCSVHPAICFGVSRFAGLVKLCRYVAIPAGGDQEFISPPSKCRSAVAAVVDLDRGLQSADLALPLGSLEDSAADNAPQPTLQISHVRLESHLQQGRVSLVVRRWFHTAVSRVGSRPRAFGICAYAQNCI
jgi:hypothetical protein